MASVIIITPRLNRLQRATNRAGRRLGVMPFPMRFQSTADVSGDRHQVFATINEANLWGSAESVSGPGSELDRTREYRAALLDLLRRRRIESMFDAPCGDLNWMRLVLDEYPLRYQGGDISEVALAEARRRRPAASLSQFDICADCFPEAQLWHCRDALFHFSFDDIWLALGNATNAEVDYALITTNKARWLRNLNIETGAMRYLDLERPPFNFGRALEYLPDYLPGEFPRYVGLWPMETIRAAVEQRNHGARGR
jgi:hypothetical protein